MRFVIFLIGILANVISIAQTSFSGYYKIKLNDEITCYIDFYKNKYDLVLLDSPTSSDMSEETPLSYGSFVKKGNKLTLHDTINGFDMQLRLLPDKNMTIEKGFTFLDGKELLYDGENWDKDKWEIWETMNFMNVRSQRYEREKYKQANKQEYAFCSGQYECEINTIVDEYDKVYDTRLGLELDVESNGKYQLFFKKILILAGTWEKQGNEIALFDNNLKHAFYILASDKGLIIISLRYYFRSHLLTLKKKVNLPKRKRKPSEKINGILDFLPSEPVQEPYKHAEESPRSTLGGKEEVLCFIKKNLRYPRKAKEAGIKGRVFVYFVIEKDGSVNENTIEIRHPLSKECDAEAIRVIKSMPRWIPGRQKGKEVAVWYTLPVEFGE
jgi:TonB family protein